VESEIRVAADAKSRVETGLAAANWDRQGQSNLVKLGQATFLVWDVGRRLGRTASAFNNQLTTFLTTFNTDLPMINNN
jgi:hypothetical protein